MIYWRVQSFYLGIDECFRETVEKRKTNCQQLPGLGLNLNRSEGLLNGQRRLGGTVIGVV
jgi:hypothetical protein